MEKETSSGEKGEGEGRKSGMRKSKREKEVQMFSKCRKQSQPNSIYDTGFHLKLFSDYFSQ